MMKKMTQLLDNKNNGYDTYIQSEIIHSINSLNYSLFHDLGGADKYDLNFCKQTNTNKNEVKEYPLFYAAAKGHI